MMNRKQMHAFSAFPLATALREGLRNYRFQTFRQDAMAAFVVSLLALPLAMALAIAVGLPPQHGIYTAIVAGIAVPLLGGSLTQVSGPTAAFVVILAPIVSEFGLRGIIWSGLLAGLMLIAMGSARLGRLVHYIPYPVTTGFTAGIAVVLAVLSLNDLLGLGVAELSGHFTDKVATLARHLLGWHWPTLLVGLAALLLLFTAGRIVPKIPAAILAMSLATLLAAGLQQAGFTVDTIGSRFTYLDALGQVRPGVPPYPPALHLPFFSDDPLFAFPGWEEWRQLLLPAVTIAVLAGLESLLSATVADTMLGTKHNPNAELNGIGVGNILSSLAAGIPATGAIARTAVNINNGGRTPISAMLHAALIMLYVLLLSPAINQVPMSALAALLVHTAWRMSHARSFLRLLRTAPRTDVIVLWVCFLLTVFIDMVAGVTAGMLCAAFLLIKQVRDLTEVAVEGVETVSTPDGQAGDVTYRLKGPLFFGSVEKAFGEYRFSHDFIRRVTLDLTAVTLTDASGLMALQQMAERILREGRQVAIITGNAALRDVLAKALDGRAEVVS